MAVSAAAARRGRAALAAAVLAAALLATAHAQDPDTDGTYGLSSPSATRTTGSSAAGTLVYAENSLGQLWRRAGVSPFNPGGSSWVLKQQAPYIAGVNLGGPYGAAWGLSGTGTAGGNVPYFENFLTGTWYATSGGLTQVDIGGPQGYIWGVNEAGIQYFRSGASPLSPGAFWIPVSNPPSNLILLSQVSIGGGGGAGDVFGLGILPNARSPGNLYVYYREGVTSARPTGTSWKRLDGGLRQISVGGGFSSDPSVGPLLSPSPSFDGTLPVVWGVNSSGFVYARTGITGSTREGTGWQFVSSSPRMSSVSVNGDGTVVWAIDRSGSLYWRYVSGGFSWNRVGEPGGGFGSDSSGVTTF